jgi:hypothetical protein
MPKKAKPRRGQFPARIDPEVERANLRQKLRLRYLLEHYAPIQLRGMELYRRLRLNDVFEVHDPSRVESNSERGFETKVVERGKRWLPNDMALRWISEGRFKQWSQLKGEPNYRPERGFERRVCDALAFILVDEFEDWPKHPPPDDVFPGKWRQLSEFIHAGGRPQPAEIFFDMRDAWAEEITHGINIKEATADVCNLFLQGRAVPQLYVVDAGATIKRNVEEQLMHEVENAQHRIILLTSAAGDGKSTIFYRLARSFFDKGWRVFFKHERQYNSKYNWPIGRKHNSRTIFFIDRAEGIQDLPSLFAWVEENPQLVVLLAAREIDWVSRGFLLETSYHRHVALGRLQENEIDSLAKLLLRHDAIGSPIQFTDLRQRIVHSTTATEFPHMLAAVMTACTDVGFSRLLESMVSSFPDQDLLKWTALCSAGRGSSGLPTFATSRLFSALLSSDREPLEIGRARFEAIHRKVRSEIVSLHGSQYDLRHPDITLFVLRYFYDADANGLLHKTSELGDDLYFIMSAVLKVILTEDTRIKRDLPESYLTDIPTSWFRSGIVGGRKVGRELFESMYMRLGSLEIDLKYRTRLLGAWTINELQFQKRDREVLTKWLPKCAHDNSELWGLQKAAHDRTDGSKMLEWLSDSYHRWAKFAVQEGLLGSMDEPEYGTARYILKEAWERHIELRNADFVHLWKEIDSSAEAIGARSDPHPYSLRWLFRSVWLLGNRRNATSMRRWAEFEADNDNVGGIVEPVAFTSRWIFQEAWRESIVDGGLISAWAKVEAANNNLGAFESPHVFSARWLLQEAWKPENRGKLATIDLIAVWAALEATQGEIGSFHEPSPYTARWLLRLAWSEKSIDSALRLTSTIHPSLFDAALQIEIYQGEIGEFNAPEPHTARWLLRNAWSLGDWDSTKIQGWRNQKFDRFHKWFRMELDHGGIGDFNRPEPFSARWLLRIVWNSTILQSLSQDISGDLSRELFNASESVIELAEQLIELEGEIGELGDFSEPESYSARWLLRTAWDNRVKGVLSGPRLIVRWISIEGQRGVVGDFDDPKAHSARWVLRRCWEESGRPNLNSTIVSRWASLEARHGRIGCSFADPESFSARWLFKSCFQGERYCDAILLANWSFIEGTFGDIGAWPVPEFGTARWAFLRALEIKHLHERYLAYWTKFEIRRSDRLRSGHPYSPEWIFGEAQARGATATQSIDEFIKVDTRGIEVHFPIP